MGKVRELREGNLIHKGEWKRDGKLLYISCPSCGAINSLNAVRVPPHFECGPCGWDDDIKLVPYDF